MSRALLSVYDKTGIEDLARGLRQQGFELISSGGTADRLEETDIPRQEVEDVTGFPEIMGGRVKTMHPMITGGILANRDNFSHLEDAVSHGIGLIDLVVCNLYPFSETVASGASWAECIEKIDVGGPTMMRSAAKNYAHVGVVVDPAHYADVLREISEYGALSDEMRLRLARKAFDHTAAYDAAIFKWLNENEPPA